MASDRAVPEATPDPASPLALPRAAAMTSDLLLALCAGLVVLAVGALAGLLWHEAVRRKRRRRNRVTE